MDSSTSSNTVSPILSSTTEDEELDNVRLEIIQRAATIIFPPRVRRSECVDKNRDRTEAQNRLSRDYFSDSPTYDEENFKRRFTNQLFEQIVPDLEHKYEYFQDSYDACGYKSFTLLQKCTSAIRKLAYGTTPDSLYEYLQMAESTSHKVLQRICDGIISLYDKQYLRKANYSDILDLYDAHSSRHGFSGMLGSLECTKWEWKNYPSALRGQYMHGDNHRPTLALQVVASQNLWIWDAYFGAARSNNDINILHMSNLFEDVCRGIAPEVPFQVNGVTYKHGYYLVD